MRKQYIKPYIKEIDIHPFNMLAGSPSLHSNIEELNVFDDDPPVDGENAW